MVKLSDYIVFRRSWVQIPAGSWNFSREFISHSLSKVNAMDLFVHVQPTLDGRHSFSNFKSACMAIRLATSPPARSAPTKHPIDKTATMNPCGGKEKRTMLKSSNPIECCQAYQDDT